MAVEVEEEEEEEEEFEEKAGFVFATGFREVGGSASVVTAIKLLAAGVSRNMGGGGSAASSLTGGEKIREETLPPRSPSWELYK